ncbi:hypothetical protein ACFE04_016591 [Oxalis oulophora]
MSSSHKVLEPSTTRHHLSSIDSCTLRLHSWRPFVDSTTTSSHGGIVYPHHQPYHTIKRPCRSDRATSLPPIDSIDLSRLSLIDDYKPIATVSQNNNNKSSRSKLRLLDKKRRRRGSRSVSGRSSDRSGTRMCCSVGATCSDFPVAIGTDSSGELFGNVADWASDVSEAKNSITRREREDKELGFTNSAAAAAAGGGLGAGSGGGQFGLDVQGNESGYGSEPGYRGDAEFGYGDEFDEEEEDTRLLFWGDQLSSGRDTQMEGVGENTFSEQKLHYRGRRKKHDCRMLSYIVPIEVVSEFGIGVLHVMLRRKDYE